MKHKLLIATTLIAVLAFCGGVLSSLYTQEVTAVTYSAQGYLVGGTAGSQVSSTYEGRHLVILESDLVHPTRTGELCTKGDPVVCGNIVGVALNTADAATDYVEIDTEGIWNLTVVGACSGGNTAIVMGDPIYINSTTAVLNHDGTTGTTKTFGYALGPVTSGASTVIAVKVHWGNYNTTSH